MKRNKPLSVRISEHELNLLEKMADKFKVEKSELVRTIIRQEAQRLKIK